MFRVVVYLVLCSLVGVNLGYVIAECRRFEFPREKIEFNNQLAGLVRRNAQEVSSVLCTGETQTTWTQYVWLKNYAIQQEKFEEARYTELTGKVVYLTRQIVKTNKNIGLIQNNKNIGLIQNKLNNLKNEMVTNGPGDCSDLYDDGESKSGVYKIFPSRYTTAEPVSVYCQMEKDSGWTVLLLRQKETEGKKQLDFYQDWAAYKEGFGSPESEYWLGNQNLHRLTAARNYVVKVDLIDYAGNSLWGAWKTFKVDSERNKYKLTVNNYVRASTAHAQLMMSHNGASFSTFDHSEKEKRCAEVNKGGFWYTKCYTINPTGIYGSKNQTGIAFAIPSNQTQSVMQYAKWVRMMIKSNTRN